MKKQTKEPGLHRVGANPWDYEYNPSKGQRIGFKDTEGKVHYGTVTDFNEDDGTGQIQLTFSTPAAIAGARRPWTSGLDEDYPGHPGENKWHFGHCNRCDVVTWPVITRWLDPAWLRWAVWQRPRLYR